MKKNIWIAVFAASALIACKDKEKEIDAMEEVSVNTYEEPEETMPVKTTSSRIYTQDDAQTFQRDFAEAVVVKDKKITSIKGWNIYTTVDEGIASLKSVKAENRIGAAQKLRSDFDKLKNSLPEYMNLRRVRRAIDKIDVRIADFEKEATDASVNENKLDRILKRISDSYDDLSKQIVKAREDYIDNREDAIEEYLEEVNDLDKNKTKEERYRDAREEYDEEMKQK